jgi:peptidoglycan hydrolase CwlO-like protein
MRRPRGVFFRRAGGAHKVSARASSRLRVAAVFAALLCAPVAAWSNSTTPASADSVNQLNASINRVAQAWFDAQATVQRLDTQIMQREQRVRDLNVRASKLRVEARERAVALYVDKGDSIATVLDGTSAIDSARRVQLIERANQHSTQTFESLTELVQTLQSQRNALVAERKGKQHALDDLARNRATLDAELRDARIAAQQAAQRAAARRARTAHTTTNVKLTSAPAAAAPAQPDPVVSAPQTPGVYPMHNHPFLVCTRNRESHGIYTVVSPSGLYYGAYQFSRNTWDVTAIHGGRPELVGVLPNTASEYDQDNLAWVLYQWQGNAPWGGRC